MQTRLRTGSLGRGRQQSIDTTADDNSGRHRMGSLDFTGISDDAGAQLVAGLKDTSTEETTRMTTRRTASRAIAIPGAGSESSSKGATLSHTPPTSHSFENQHFGKRPRAGSVSGRLRSASVLEDEGLINRDQKQILKDLIISGDEELQAALDKYEKGDSADLEAMLKSGELASRHAADVDLLGDLDLDFLNVDDHFGADALGGGGGEAAAAGMNRGGAAKQIPPNMISDDDGITNLDLHHGSSGAGGGGEEDFLQQGINTRLRSNSLAYGPLLNDHGTQDTSNPVQQYGGWMDRGIREGRVGSIASCTTAEAPPDAPAVGGLAESLAQYAAKTKADSKPLTKAQLAEQKRRERQEKKEQKEREKQEKKEQRERARALKKERDAREKQARKKKKGTTGASKTKQKKEKPKPKEEEEEEPKVIVSGTGRPRSMSDPNLSTSIDEFGLMSVERPDGWVGAYSPESRKIRIDRFMAKRNHRVWTKKVKYDVRKNFADSRLRVKGRFVKKEDELLMRDLMSLT